MRIRHHQNDFIDLRHLRMLLSIPFRQICTMILGGRLADVVGGKWVYGVGLLLSSLLSLFTPLLLTERDAWAAFGLRIAQGCLQGVTFPALHALTVRWTTAGGRGLFVAKVRYYVLVELHKS